MKEIERRRTFAIISHPDAGKTTLTEKFLLFGGQIQVAGAVKNNKIRKSATSDWMDIEKQRGISVSTSVMEFDYLPDGQSGEPYKVNILDTPGHQDFCEDTYRTLTAVDSAIIVVDSAKGVEAQTRKLMEVCRMRNTPVIIFINKMDREGRDPFDVLDELEEELKISVRPLSWPIGQGARFKGVYNIYEHQLNLFTPNKQRVTEKVEVDVQSEELDQRVGEREAAQLREELELVDGVYPEFDVETYRSAEVAPVFFGSALNNFGVQELLDCFVQIAPSPRPTKAEERMVEPEEPKFTGFIFKITANIDPNHRSCIAFCKKVFEAMSDKEAYPETVNLAYFFGEEGRKAHLNPIMYPDSTVVARCAMIHDAGDHTPEVLDMWSKVKGDNLGGGIVIFLLAVVLGLTVFVSIKKIEHYKHRRLSRKHRRHHIIKVKG